METSGTNCSGPRVTPFITNDNDVGNELLLVGMAQVHTDKTLTSLNANALVPYPLYIGLINLIYEFRRHLINHGYEFSELIPVSTSDSNQKEIELLLDESFESQLLIVSLNDVLAASKDRKARTVKLEVM